MMLQKQSRVMDKLNGNSIHRLEDIMRRGIVIFIFAALLAPIVVNSCASSETVDDLLIGEWDVTTSVPSVSPHHRFVFFEDNTFAIYDENGRMIEKNEMTDTTDHSFVGNVVYAAKHHPVPGIAGTSTYATYRFIGKDTLILRFYDDDTLETLYVKFQLDRAAYTSSADPTPAAGQESISSEEAVVFRDEDCSSLVTIDFDSKMPDWQYSREGAHLEVVHDPLINDTQIGVITVPGGTAANRSGLPYATFRIDYQGRLGDTIASFRAHIPKSSYEWRSPYVVFAVTADGDPEPDGWVVGGRRVGSGYDPRADKTWFEYRLDMDAPVHAADYRENLGGKFTPHNMGTFADLVKTPLRDERVWGDLRIVFVGVSAGAWGGPAFKAYVDDIKVCTTRPPEPETLHALLKTLCRNLAHDLGTKGEGTIAISGFSTREGKSSELNTLLDEMVLLEFTELGTLEVIGHEQVDRLLTEQALALPDLMDTGRAVDIGKLLTANYIFTGTIVEMPTSVVIFGRILDVETGQIEATQQVTVPKNDELQALLQ
jgi:hypothetical protein